MFSREFIFQVFALICSVLLVHSVYLAGVRPHAEAALKEQRQAIESGSTDEVPNSLAVLIKDYEQEACFILLFWALAIIGYKFREVGAERRLLGADLFAIPDGMRILPDDTLDLSRKIQALSPSEQVRLLPRALLSGLSRFRATQNVQDVSNTTQDICESEGDRLDSELSMVRYIAWAIPSIGFIGTVRGIGQALGKAHLAVEGDITEVTQSLGVAFNSTLIALFISILLMFVVHQLQLMQERYVLEVSRYCDDNLVSNLESE